MCIRDSLHISYIVVWLQYYRWFDINDIKFNEQNIKLESKFDELKIDINAVSDSCESNFKELERNI